MYEKTIAYHDGTPFDITEITISMNDGIMEIRMWGTHEKSVREYRFYNVSGLSISDMSPPMRIQAFHIINHQQSGWEHCNTYEFKDYEDGVLHFYCETIEIL